MHSECDFSLWIYPDLVILLVSLDQNKGAFAALQPRDPDVSAFRFEPCPTQASSEQPA